MKTAAILAMLMMPSIAFAGTLPISGAYGTAMGCAVYSNRASQGDPESIVYVTGTNATGMEYACEVGEVVKVADGFRVKLACDGEGDQYAAEATFTEIGSGKAVWSIDGAPYVLTRCD